MFHYQTCLITHVVVLFTYFPKFNILKGTIGGLKILPRLLGKIASRSDVANVSGLILTFKLSRDSEKNLWLQLFFIMLDIGINKT